MKINRLASTANLGGALYQKLIAITTTARKPIGFCFNKASILIACLAIIKTGYISTSFAATSPVVSLSWNANPETDITGYQVSYGTTSKVYNKVINVGTSPAASITDLVEGKTYYFAVKAVNSAGLQSTYSNEISYYVEPPVVDPPVVDPPVVEPPVVDPPVVPPTTGWTLLYVNSQQSSNYQGSYAFDDDPNTFWHTAWTGNSPPPPHEIQIDLKNSETINGFRYLPRQDYLLVGTVGQFEFYVSQDGVNWGNPVATGTFQNSHDSKEIRFDPTSARYIRFRGLTDANGGQYMTVAELELIQESNPPPVNHAPLATASAKTVTEDASVTIILQGTDVDGDSLTYSLATTPNHGALTGNPPNLTYKPSANYNGSDSFTFLVNDGILDSSTATVSISVTPVNDAPVANGNSYTTKENQSIPVTLTGSDVDGDSITYSIRSNPSNGTLTGTRPDLTYVPNPGFSGSDQFRFRVNDGKTNSSTVTVTIEVSSINHAPVATSKSATTSEDNALSIQLGATDSDGDNLSFAIVSNPAHGSISGTAPNLTYTPAPNYYGSDQLTFLANDGSLDSQPATISITITSVNDAPVALGKSVITAEDTLLPISLTGTDVDGDPLTYLIITGPTHGTLSGTAPNIKYMPTADYNGNDSFTFRVRDGVLNSETVSININVTPVNDAPVAVSQSITTAEETPLSIVLTGTDKDLNQLSFNVITGPSHGTLSGTAPNLTYRPAANYNGPDMFTFRVNDGTVNSSQATISIAVNATNDAPVALENSVITKEDTALPIVLKGTDTEESPLSFKILTGPTRGSLSGNPPNVSYTPSPDFNGNDSITFLVNDGSLDSQPATVSIKVTPVNDAPVAISNDLETPAGTSLKIMLSGSDPDGTSPALTVITNPTNGVLSGTTPDLSYLPNPGFSGNDQFTFQANDGLLSSPSATISITVTPVNKPTQISPPAFAANPISFQTSENHTFSNQLIATGANLGGVITFTKVSGPSWLTVSTSGALGGVPLNGNVGLNSFVVRASNQVGGSSDAVLNITVNNVNNAPTFVSNPVIVEDASENSDYIGQSISGAAVDSDTGDSLTYMKVSGPEWLDISSTGELAGTPPTGSAGLNTFIIRASDTTASVDAELHINVVGLPLPWSTADLGTDHFEGTTSYLSGNFSMTGSGAFGGRRDKIRFTYQSLIGDGEITARIKSREDTGPFALVGVMIRDSLAANSRQVFMGLNSSNSYRWVRRTSTGRNNFSKNCGSGSMPDTWVRLVRRYNVITAYKSDDGVKWDSVGSTYIRLSANCYVGLTVSSGSSDEYNTAEFSNVQMTRFSPTSASKSRLVRRNRKIRR